MLTDPGKLGSVDVPTPTRTWRALLAPQRVEEEEEEEEKDGARTRVGRVPVARPLASFAARSVLVFVLGAKDNGGMKGEGGELTVFSN